MHLGIQTKVTLFLVVLLAFAFGISTALSARQTARTLREDSLKQVAVIFEGVDSGMELMMQRGAMADLQTLIQRLGKADGVEEIGLTAADGSVRNSSRREGRTGVLDAPILRATVAARGGNHVEERGNSLFRAQAHYFEAGCETCHQGTKPGQLAGILFVRYSAKAFRSAQMRTVLTTAGAGLGGLLAASVGVYFLVGLLVRTPLEQLTRRMKEMADGHADLTRRLPVRTADEMGAVASAFNAFIENLQGLISRVLQTTREVGSGTEEIQTASETVLERATQQNARTQAAATSAEEMSSVVLEASRSAHEAAAAAKNASTVASEGGTTVASAIEAMARVEQSVRAIATKVEDLEGRSHAIGDLMQVINDIADQTNLLALNAAIEAARAGENGRGFAVVADEVRKLAEKTAGATSQVSETVLAIQNETRHAVALVNHGLEETGRSAALSRDAEESLHRIVASIEKNSEMISQIATASEQQSASVADISQNLESIASLSDDMVGAVAKARDITEGLTSTAGRLSDLVGTFAV